jgi:hypothetical protein
VPDGADWAEGTAGEINGAVDGIEARGASLAICGNRARAGEASGAANLTDIRSGTWIYASRLAHTAELGGLLGLLYVEIHIVKRHYGHVGRQQQCP